MAFGKYKSSWPQSAYIVTTILRAGTSGIVSSSTMNIVYEMLPLKNYLFVRPEMWSENTWNGRKEDGVGLS